MDKNRKLIIAKPFGGIANRMRVISSMLWLKQNFEVELKIIWLANEELNAQYQDLFQDHPDFELIDFLGKYKNIRTSNQKNSFKRSIASAVNKSLGIDYCIFDSDIYEGVENVLEIIKSNDTIFINTCEEFIHWDEGLRSLKLLRPIQEHLNNLTDKLEFNSHTIGLHIRRTDHYIAIENSPINLFEDVISKELISNSKSNFYLASDDPIVLGHFKSRFGEAIKFIDKHFGRDSKEGIIDGILELYLLSRTRKIYGSYWSSYSKIAGRISNIAVESLKK